MSCRLLCPPRQTPILLPSMHMAYLGSGLRRTIVVCGSFRSPPSTEVRTNSMRERALMLSKSWIHDTIMRIRKSASYMGRMVQVVAFTLVGLLKLLLWSYGRCLRLWMNAYDILLNATRAAEIQIMFKHPAEAKLPGSYRESRHF